MNRKRFILFNFVLFGFVIESLDSSIYLSIYLSHICVEHLGLDIFVKLIIIVSA